MSPRSWLLAVLLLAAGLPASTRTPTDPEVKAAFLLHFTRLVEWPPEVPKEPVVIAVIGNEAFARTLEALAARETPKRNLTIVRYEPAELRRRQVHVAFVGSGAPSDARAALRAVSGAVLTVGDVPEFARRGGMIGFRITDDGRVSFDVNLARARAAGLQISSQLLKVARVVEDDP